MSEASTINCGDCNAINPEWASLNRGLLLCKGCCYIHRTLGPQFTKVKSLKHSEWHPSLKKMVYTLAAGPANHVWEYTLLIEPSKADLKFKPGPNDPIDPKKRKFITAKHLHYQFVRRQKSDSLSTELHSTVRTSDIGTSLRLLASGGDPNFFHPIVGTRPLHVAARSGQALQVELLFLHGAQTDGLDYLGQTPVEHALAAGHKDLAHRLLELRYHLTDELSRFVCGKVPDHSFSKHIIIPKEIPIIEPHRKTQEQMLRKQPPQVLEQFAADLYDEIDRRSLEKAMIGKATGVEASKYSVAFLPVHSYFPSVRNQTRQKFARLTNDDLSSLITLVLLESKRRHCNITATDIEADKDIFLSSESSEISVKKSTSAPNSTNPSKAAVEDDDFPLYDNVASDDELLTEEQTMLSPQRSAIEVSSVSSSNVNPVSSCDSSDGDHSRLSAKLMESEVKIQELLESNQSMKMEILVLQQMVGAVISENLELKKTSVHHQHHRHELNHSVATSPAELHNGHNGGGIRTNSPELLSFKSRPPRPLSMCDTRADKTDGMGTRPNSTELYLRKRQAQQVLPPLNPSELVHDTTRKVVELIKVLIEQANANNTLGLQLTCSKIHQETHQMASSLMQEYETSEVKESLERVLFEVLRMKSEIGILVTQYPSKSFQNTNNGSQEKYHLKSTQVHPSPDLVQKIKQICFDVGASMKQLVSITFP